MGIFGTLVQSGLLVYEREIIQGFRTGCHGDKTMFSFMKLSCFAFTDVCCYLSRIQLSVKKSMSDEKWMVLVAIVVDFMPKIASYN